MREELILIRKLLDEPGDGTKVKKLQALLAKIFPYSRYLNFELNFPAGYPRLKLGYIDMVTLSPSQLFTADYTVPPLESRGAVYIAPTGTGKTISIFLDVASALMNPTVIDPPVGDYKIPHQVFVVTKASLVNDTAKDLSALFARDPGEIVNSWNSRFGTNVVNNGPVPFNHQDYVMSYAQFQNILLGRSNRGRRFWAGKILEGDATCKSQVGGMVPTAYRKTKDGYVRGQASWDIAVRASDRVMSMTFEGPRVNKGVIQNVETWRSIWGWGGRRPIKVTLGSKPSLNKYFYAEENIAPEKLASLTDFDENIHGVAFNTWIQSSVDGFFATLNNAFKNFFSGKAGSTGMQSISNLRLVDQSETRKVLSFSVQWKPRVNEYNIQLIFADKENLLAMTSWLKTKYTPLRSLDVAEVPPNENRGWILDSNGKYRPLEANETESNFNPCDNITVIFDEAHLLVKSETLEPGEAVDFALISTAMRESNMTVHFFTATVTFYVLMAFMQALHPKYTIDNGKWPNLPFEEAYPNIAEYQTEEAKVLLQHYLPYFSFTKKTTVLKTEGLSIGLSDKGTKVLADQCAGLLSMHPDLKTQMHFFSRPIYGGASETDHVIYGIANSEHTRYLLAKYKDFSARKLQYAINFYNYEKVKIQRRDGEIEERIPINITPNFMFGMREFDMDQFVEKVVIGGNGGKQAPFCWFALSLLTKIRERDEMESATLRDGEKLSRIIISTGVSDDHGANLIAGILQSAGYQWIEINTRKLTPEQRKLADQSWARNQVPKEELRKVAVNRNLFTKEFNKSLAANYGPTERRRREGSTRFISYSTTLVNYASVSVESLEQLTELVRLQDYRTPFKGKRASELRKMEGLVVVPADKQDEKRESIESFADKVIYFWPGAKNRIVDPKLKEIRVVAAANAMWKAVEEKFFFVRFLDNTKDPAEMSVQRIDFSYLMANTNLETTQDVERFVVFFDPDKELDAEGKKELVQSLKELTNDPGETINEVGIVVLGNKFDSGVDVFMSTCSIYTEPYLDWTQHEQRNGRGNRRRGMADADYRRWEQYQYCMALKWPNNIGDQLGTVRKSQKDLLEPSLEALGVEKISSVKGLTKEQAKEYLKGLNKYTSAVITSILRNPITDIRPNENKIGSETLLQPYELVRVKAIGHPVSEVLNLLGIKAMTGVAFDLPFTQPLKAAENPSEMLKPGVGKDKVPAAIPTKYLLYLRGLERYSKNVPINRAIEAMLQLRDSAIATGQTFDFAYIVRNASDKLFIEHNGSYSMIPPEYFGVDSPRQLLRVLVEQGLAVWYAKPPLVPKLPKQGKAKAGGKRKTRDIEQSFNNTLLQYRLQPVYEPIEKTITFVDNFNRYSEGDREQKAIEQMLFPRAIKRAQELHKWDYVISAETTPEQALTLLAEKILPKNPLSYRFQRELQHGASIMQYYGLMNWNLAVVLIVGIALTKQLIAEGDLLIAAILASHCYRGALVELGAWNRRWDIVYEDMTPEECSYFLALISSWTSNADDMPTLSRTFSELAELADEPIDKIFSELYTNFSISVRKNLEVLVSMVDVPERVIGIKEKKSNLPTKNRLSTAELIRKFVATSKLYEPKEGANANAVQLTLISLIDPANADIPYEKLITNTILASSAGNAYVRVLNFFELDSEQNAQRILTATSILQFIEDLWPQIALNMSPELTALLNFYTRDQLAEELAQRSVKKNKNKFPANAAMLLEEIQARLRKRRLPFRAVDQFGKKVLKTQLIQYVYSQPENPNSIILQNIGETQQSTGATLQELILSDRIVYVPKISPAWSFDSLASTLAATLTGPVAFGQSLVANYLPLILAGRTFSNAQAFFNMIYKNSGFLDPESRLMKDLRAQFETWGARFAEPGENVSTDILQEQLFPLWVAIRTTYVERFLKFVEQIMPKANAFWELFQLHTAEGEPDPKMLASPNYKLLFLQELVSRSVDPDQPNYADIALFKENIVKIQLLQKTQEDVLGALAKARAGKPGISIFINAGKVLLDQVEEQLYLAQGITKPPKKPKGTPAKSAEQTPKKPKPDEESEEEVAVLESDEEMLDIVPGEEEIDVDEFRFQALCPTCFAQPGDPECQCN